jgi:hypothetical protein
MDKVTTVGIDLAKSVYSLHGVDGAGRVVLRRTVRRDQLMQTVAAQSPCLIGMEACSGAHQWGRRFQGLGHTVKLMAPKFVAPYRKSGCWRCTGSGRTRGRFAHGRDNSTGLLGLAKCRTETLLGIP